MATSIPSAQDLYDLGKAELQGRAPQLTDFNEGSISDIIIGLTQTIADEVIDLFIDRYNKLFIDTATGADLDTLGQDHWGLSRQGAVAATGTAHFARATTGAGNVNIADGYTFRSVTQPDGTTIQFKTVGAVVMTGTTLDVPAICKVTGSLGNVAAGQTTVLVDALSDPSITVTNAAPFAGGADADDDPAYRQAIKDQASRIRGAAKSAVEARARQVAGVVNASIQETYIPVVQWDPIGLATVGAPFNIIKPTLYVSDAAGASSTTMLGNVLAAIDDTRAAGVYINVAGGTLYSLSVQISLTFSIGASTSLMADPVAIRQKIVDLVNAIPAGGTFSRATVVSAILAIWGPSGTADLTACSIPSPAGDVVASASQVIRTNLGLVTVA